MRIIFRVALFCYLFLCGKAYGFPVYSNGKAADIYYSKSPGDPLDSIVAHLFANDIQTLTGIRPRIITDWNKSSGHLIVIGKAGQHFISQLASSSPILQPISGKWETFGSATITHPLFSDKKALLLIGSDPRGMAYGVFDVSKKLGLSPWYWMADVVPEKKTELILPDTTFISNEPSVKFRGIFLNDEDWGLQPWAARTFEPETGDIGPKTYSRIFEWMLRMKANIIWPAMHPSTRSFFTYPGNLRAARDYHIVIGSSHAEPMLRNNVDEWKKATMGAFNFLTNKETILRYWEERVQETKNLDAVYTLGMRGVHDSGMEGVKSAEEAVPLLENIIRQQREMLEKHRKTPVERIPQTFTAYKEVLDIYDNGLRLPEDVILTWPDDNYGYIRRLNNKEEEKRKGGSGVYYHASYWGRPHDYLWLGSTHPALIREEMMKAYHNGSDRLWILNVGDIKPLEYNISLFLDMAYNTKPFEEGASVKNHLKQWVKEVFEKESSNRIMNIVQDQIANTLWEYYQLAFERRPEFMGWSQTEPTTPTGFTAYNHFYFGDEAGKRLLQHIILDAYVEQQSEMLAELTPANTNAFFQLVGYPLSAASLMNQKVLYGEKAWYYFRQKRISWKHYAWSSMEAYRGIQQLTRQYNDSVSNGKWKGMMDMAPRKLPVFDAPILPDSSFVPEKSWNVLPEGHPIDSGQTKKFPVFTRAGKEKYFLDLFLSKEKKIQWKATGSVPWIKLSVSAGTLLPQGFRSEERIWVEIDWSRFPNKQTEHAYITIRADNQVQQLPLEVRSSEETEEKIFREKAGFVYFPATSFHAQYAPIDHGWEVVPDLGHSGSSLHASRSYPNPSDGFVHGAFVSYEFMNETEGPANLSIAALPTHPLNNETGMRYAIQLDDEPQQILNFETFGRSDEWKQNVLQNKAIKSISLPHLKKGKHRLKIFCIDEGVLLDYIMINFTQRKPYRIPLNGTIEYER